MNIVYDSDDSFFGGTQKKDKKSIKNGYHSSKDSRKLSVNYSMDENKKYDDDFDDDPHYSDSFEDPDEFSSTKQSTEYSHTTRKQIHSGTPSRITTYSRGPPRRSNIGGGSSLSRVSNSTMKTSPRTAAEFIEARIRSAKRLRMNELRSEIQQLYVQIENLSRENKVLKRMQRLQERELDVVRGGENELPALIQRHSNEVETLRKLVRKNKQQCQETQKQLKFSEKELDKVRRQLTKYKSMADEKRLPERSELSDKLETTEIQLEEKTRRVNELERYIEKLQKNFKRQIANEIAKTKASDKELHLMQEKNFQLEQKIKEKDKELDIRNIYSNRMHKNPHRLYGSSLSIHNGANFPRPEPPSVQDTHSSGSFKENLSKNVDDPRKTNSILSSDGAVNGGAPHVDNTLTVSSTKHSITPLSTSRGKPSMIPTSTREPQRLDKIAGEISNDNKITKGQKQQELNQNESEIMKQIKEAQQEAENHVKQLEEERRQREENQRKEKEKRLFEEKKRSEAEKLQKEKAMKEREEAARKQQEEERRKNEEARLKQERDRLGINSKVNEDRATKDALLAKLAEIDSVSPTVTNNQSTFITQSADSNNNTKSNNKYSDKDAFGATTKAKPLSPEKKAQFPWDSSAKIDLSNTTKGKNDIKPYNFTQETRNLHNGIPASPPKSTAYSNNAPIVPKSTSDKFNSKKKSVFDDSDSEEEQIETFGKTNKISIPQGSSSFKMNPSMDFKAPKQHRLPQQPNGTYSFNQNTAATSKLVNTSGPGMINDTNDHLLPRRGRNEPAEIARTAAIHSKPTIKASVREIDDIEEVVL